MGARMMEFAGYEMPVEYSGVISEHLAVRNAVGMFDVSHMGEIWVKGKGAKELLQRVCSNDVELLYPGKAQYSCLPNGKGGIIDDLIVHHFEELKYFLAVNAANTGKDYDWLTEQNSYGAEIENASDHIAQLAIQGPKADDVLQKLTAVDLGVIKPFHFAVAALGTAENTIIARTGYTGAGGFEIYVENENALPLWDQIYEAGREFNLKPVGLAARDTLRLEMGYSLYGNDIDDTTSPIEAGLGWITKLHDDKNLIDKDYLQKQKLEGVKRKLVGFEMIDRGIPRQHYEIFDASDNRIGNVTSGTMSPILNKGIGMGYVSTPWSVPGKQIYINIRNRMLLARIVRLPFIVLPQ